MLMMKYLKKFFAMKEPRPGGLMVCKDFSGDICPLLVKVVPLL
jgi:hypothetical protein